jgi:uncharacterized membrane protein
MTVTFSIWSAIGWTIELVLIFALAVFVRIWLRLNSEFKTLREDTDRAARLAREKFAGIERGAGRD